MISPKRHERTIKFGFCLSLTPNSPWGSMRSFTAAGEQVGVIQVVKVGIGITKRAKRDVKEFSIAMKCIEILSKCAKMTYGRQRFWYVRVLLPLAYGSICSMRRRSCPQQLQAFLFSMPGKLDWTVNRAASEMFLGSQSVEIYHPSSSRLGRPDYESQCQH